jgi:hypothetical protein
VLHHRQARADHAALDVGLATTTGDYDGAFRLVHDRYVARGYMPPQPSGRRLGAHHALASTKVVVGRHRGRVVATLSVIADSPLGVPSDALWPAEIDALRAGGRRIAEISALAVDPVGPVRGLGAVRLLVQLVAVYAAAVAGLDVLCIAVHPRHAPFYEARLAFERFAAVAPCRAVGGAPAVPLALCLHGPAGAGRDRLAAELLDGGAVARALAVLARDLDGSAMTAEQRACFFPAGAGRPCNLFTRDPYRVSPHHRTGVLGSPRPGDKASERWSSISSVR